MTDYLKRIIKVIKCIRDENNIRDYVEYITITIIVAILFYDSLIAVWIFMPGVIFYRRYKEKHRQIKRNQNVREEFICAMDGMCSALSAGYSLTNSFMEAARQVKKVYGENCITYMDFMIIVRQISLNGNLDEIMDKYSKRSLIDEIRYFCEIIPVSRKEGGDVVNVIKEIRNMSIEKVELERQIQVVSSSKRSEAAIMSLMPVGIMGYLRISSPDFFNGMYGNITGAAIMTIILAVYLMFVILADRIGEIKGG